MNNQAKFTPGPWEVNTNGAGHTAVFGKRGSPVCVFGQGFDEEFHRFRKHKANAALIAAAPDMYKALEEFDIKDCSECDATGLEPGTNGDACRECGGCGEVIRGGWPNAIKTALAKARGETTGESE